MADKPKRGEEAKEGEKKPEPAPLTGFFLELYFPMTRAILPTHYPSEHEAVQAAFAHFVAFPKGYAQIRQAANNAVVLNHQQLFQRYQGSR